MAKSSKDKVLAASGIATTGTGAAIALGGEAALWSVYSAGAGAALSGAAETYGFLAWVGGGSLAAGGGGIAAGSAVLAAIGPVGWSIVGIGVAVTSVAVTSVAAFRRKKYKK